MTKPTLDELIVPAPPYRMARPVASLAMARDEFKNDAMRQQLEGVIAAGKQSEVQKEGLEAPPSTPENLQTQMTIERANAAEKRRDISLEVTDPSLRMRGEEIAEASGAIRKFVAEPVPAMVSTETVPELTAEAVPDMALSEPASVEVSPPVTPEVGSETVYIKPEAPSGKYEMPSDAKSDLDRIVAKQAELRAAGKEEEAKQWDVAKAKYENYLAKNAAPVAGAPKQLEGLEAERESVANAKGMSEENRAALLKEYDEAIAKEGAAKSDSGSGENAEYPAAPAPTPEIGSETIYVKPGESPDKAPEVPVTEKPEEPLAPEAVPAKPKKDLTLEEERASVAKAKGFTEEKRASLLKEYDEAIAKRDAPVAEKPKVKPTAEELEAYQNELKEKAAAAVRAEQESRGAEMATEAGAADRAQKKAVVEAYEEKRAQMKAEADAKAAAERAEQEVRGAQMASEAEAKIRSEQESRGQQIAAETDARLKKEADRKIPRPAEIARLRDAKEHITAKPENRSWLQTIFDRVHAWQTRAEIVDRARWQSQAQSKFELAQGKISDYERKLQDAGPLTRMWYASRLKSWQAYSMKSEGQVAKWNAEREVLHERQAEYIRSVVERYDGVLAPYRERSKDLSDRLSVQASVREKLVERRKDALLELAKAEVAAKRGRWFKEPVAAKAMADIKEQLREIDRRISDADTKAQRYRSVLTDAELKIRSLEGKRAAAEERLTFPEFGKLKLPAHEPLSTAAPTESAPAAPEADPSDVAWKIEDLIEQWNGLGLQPIDDPASLIENVRDEVRRLNLRGAPKAKDLKAIVLKYLDVTTRQQKKVLEGDWKRFLEKAKPKS